MKLPLVGQSYTARSVAAAEQDCINVFPELIQDPQERGKNQAILVGCPGRHLFKTLTTIDANLTPVRGVWTGGGRLFVFAGARYCELNSSGALVGSVRTIVNASNQPVQAFGNGNQLLIISDSTVYIDNGAGPVAINIDSSAGTVNTSGTTVTWVSGDKFPTGNQWEGKAITINAVGYTISSITSETVLVLTGSAGTQTGVAYSQAGEALTGVTGAYLDGTFLVQRPSGGTPDLGRQINFSAVLNGSNWDPLDFFLKEGYPDYVRSILANNEQLYAFGTETMQVFQDTGDADTPFQPIRGTMHRVGSVSAWSPIAIDNQIFFIGGSGGRISAYVLEGFTPRRISTHAEETAWNTAALGASCVSYAYQEEGHSFWVINFGSQTWAYDTTTGFWHQRYAYAIGAFVPYTMLYHAFVEWPNGTSQHIVGGGNGSLYDASINFYDDVGADIKWQRTLPHIYNGGKRQFFSRIELEMETGVGGSDVVNLEVSNDRGATFGTARSLGSPGGTTKTTRLFLNRLGSARDWLPRFSGVGQRKVVLINCELDMEVGQH